MRYRPGAHRSFRPRHRHWLRGLLLAVLFAVAAVSRAPCSEQQKRDDCRRPSGVGHISN